MSGKLRLYGNLSFIGVILKDVGLPRPAIQDIDELARRGQPGNDHRGGGWTESSTPATEIPPTPARPRLLPDRCGPAWTQSRKDAPTEVSDETWFLGLGPTGAGLVLDDLQAKLGK